MDIQQNNGKQGVRTRHIDIRLTENEYEMIVEKAAECGLTLSNYGRKLLQNHHPNKRLSDEATRPRLPGALAGSGTRCVS